MQGVFPFDSPESNWPDMAKFPINWKPLYRKVFNVVKDDISDTQELLIITGYTSLGYIIDFTVREINFLKTNKVRVVLGFEPERIHRRKSWDKIPLDKIVKEYWLNEGISVFKSGAVIKTIKNIEDGKVDFRLLKKLHAKLYLTDSAGMIGSSNFSKNGLYNQIEANIRVLSKSDNEEERNQFLGIRMLGENYWAKGNDYNEKIISLLKKLLLVVTWEEALSRAISELIEGKNLNDYPALLEILNNIKLWPSQKMALGQALNILKEHGTILIAEPTGSGKTRLISSLRLALTHWYIESRKKIKLETLIICPKIVENNWQNESIELSFISEAQISMGLLSRCGKTKRKQIAQRMKNADLLIIDEAHNFLKTSSNRSKKISENTAECIILATATPINKKAKDLLRLIELLDVDNLKDDELEQYKKLRQELNISDKSRNEWTIHDEEQIENLRQYIWKFTVRRTKKQLKELIEREPHLYCNREGIPCTYPEHKCLTYETGETELDKKIANEINKLAGTLNGVSRLRKVKKPVYLKEEDYDVYLNRLIKGAKALSIYNIQAALRSSKIALFEHVLGTEYAMKKFELKDLQKKPSGDILGKIEKYKNSLPKIDFPENTIPEWLRDEQKYQNACEEEINTYKQIANLVEKLSDNREKHKVKQITKTLEKHSIVIAFDSTVITLIYLQKLIRKNPLIECDTLFGGSNKNKNILTKFELGSKSKNLVGLCSDSMSEGVNMQQSSALILLDMPSVLRIAEQRIGRLERLDSPHKEIEVFWPNDSEAFALKADKKLIKTLNITEALIGSNLELPEKLNSIKVEDVIDSFNESQKEGVIWDGISDAYSKIYALFEGNKSIISKEDYLSLKDVNSDVKCKLSIGISENPWIFITMKSTRSRPAKWLFIDSQNNLYSDLGDVCERLRKNLNGIEKWEKEWNENTQSEMDKYLSLLQKKEKELLPPKKRRTLDVAEQILKRLLKKARKSLPHEKDMKRIGLITDLITSFNSFNEDTSIDYYVYSEIWHNELKPFLEEARDKNRNKRKVISLSDLVKIRAIDFSTLTLEKVYKKIPIEENVWNQVAACIIAVPEIESLDEGVKMKAATLFT